MTSQHRDGSSSGGSERVSGLMPKGFGQAGLSHSCAILAAVSELLTELIKRAPWREAAMYQDAWPHEHVLSDEVGQRDLLAAICDRFAAGEGVAVQFFAMANMHMFVGDYRYWLMTDWRGIDPLAGDDDCVIIRTRLYRDSGDTGRRGAYARMPAVQRSD